LTIVDLMHARIVYDIRRKERRAAKKGGVAQTRKARLKQIEKEIDAEWGKRGGALLTERRA